MYTESQTQRDTEGDGLFIQPLAISQGHSVLVCLWGNREYISLPQESDLPVCFFSQLLPNLRAFSLTHVKYKTARGWGGGEVITEDSKYLYVCPLPIE